MDIPFNHLIMARRADMTNAPQNEITKEVLFQKLGQTWYIFTEVNEQVI